MTGGSPGPVRLTPRQALGWGIAFALIAACIVLYFVFGRAVRPLVD